MQTSPLQSPSKSLIVADKDVNELKESMKKLRSVKNSVMHSRMQRFLENDVPSFAKQELDPRVQASYIYKGRKNQQFHSIASHEDTMRADR